jgi:hypothetical protein
MKTIMVRILAYDKTAEDIMAFFPAGQIEDAVAPGSCEVDDILLMEVVPLWPAYSYGSEDLSADAAQRVADDITNSGDINYTDASGSTVNVSVGDVTVESA